jgi:hypothetical protein
MGMKGERERGRVKEKRKGGGGVKNAVSTKLHH